MKDGNVSSQRMSEGAPPVVERPDLPRMGEEPMGGGVMMPESRMPGESDEAVMGATDTPAAELRSAGGEFPPQEGGAPSARREEKYVRIRLRVEAGSMSVVESHEVEGPLVEPAALHGSHAYEVAVGSKRIRTGMIPDLGVWRSFPDPKSPEHSGHHITEEDTYEFNVRIPSDKLVHAKPSDVEIVLYRVKTPSDVAPLALGPLHETQGRELREVARVKGIPAGILKNP